MNLDELIIPPLDKAPSEVAQEIAEALKAPLWIVQLLWQRGCKSVEQAQEFLDGPQTSICSPWLLKGMEDAVEVLLRYRENGKDICIFGDYDLDGISGAALLVLALRRAGGWRLNYRLPSRFDGGYGLGVPQLQEMAAAGIRCLVLVDTGITATAEIAKAKELGLDVIIVDHHRPPDDGMPPADAILDPWQEGCTYPNKDLSAVGVALKFATALYERIDLGGADDFLDLVTLGTLSDMMPMGLENRQMLRRALARMNLSVFPGVRVLCEDVVDSEGYLGSQDILFRIAPLMNAPGRLARPDTALEMLLSPDLPTARRTLEKLRTDNEKRRAVELEVTKIAMQQAEERVRNAKVLVVDGINWHLGVLGIVASKLTQQFGRPAAVVSVSTEGIASGSVRGVAGFNWHQALSDARDSFDRWGGHQNAAGFSLKAELIPHIRESFEASALQQGYEPGVASPILEVHAEVRLTEMNQAAMEWLRRLEPYGRGNAQPIFVARKVLLPSGVREVRGGHLQFEVMQEEGVRYGAIGFGFAHATEWLRAHGQEGIDLAFAPTWNSYKGRRVLQLQVKYLARSSV